MDITQQRKREKDTRQALALFKTIFEGSATGMALVDTEGKVIKANSALIELLGYTEKELQQMSFPKFTHPEDVELDLNQFKRLKKNMLEKYKIQKRYISKEGRTIPVLLAVSAIRSEEKGENYFVAQVTDMSDYKKTLNELEQKNTELERMTKLMVGRELKLAELKKKYRIPNDENSN